MKYFPDLENKTVIITGGSKGIGKSIALAFAEHGSNVVIVGRSESSLVEATDELKKYNSNCSYISADLKNVDVINQTIDEAVRRMGSLDVLVNNAGANITKPSLEVTEEDWDQVLDINLKGSFFCCKKAAEYMIPKNSGKIVNIASQMAFVGYWNRAAYCSSKGGIVQLTKALAVEWAEYKLNVNSVAPTFIRTELTEKTFENKALKEDIYRRIPLGNLADPEDVAGAVLYLSSNISKFITGDTIKVDGGWTAI